MLVQSFPPILCPQPKALILGSMPGQRSLEMRQYYAHPKNSFWRIMGEICAARLELPYAERISALQRAGLALWDVLEFCERLGSLDGNIQASSEKANDIAGMLRQYPTIQAIGFNGGKAWAAFRRLVLPQINPETAARLEFHPLPSTSPANAGQSYDQKLGRWQVMEKYLSS